MPMKLNAKGQLISNWIYVLRFNEAGEKWSNSGKFECIDLSSRQAWENCLK